MAERAQPGLRQVLLVSAAAVAIVLGAAILTSFLPADAQEVVFRQPIAIVVLVAGTAWVLWRVATRRPPEP
ncbi:MAG TPA: hypothetical protein VFX65_00280 [Candidatus Limnocylindrales bacterium]|nr:hypothetical protein [Candidatus Limnocylindrales bacterium]